MAATPLSPRTIALIFLAMALVFYGLGLATAATAFIVLGVAAELMFWVNLFRRK